MSIQENIMIPTQLVDVENIDDSSGPFCMSFGFDLRPLIRSIDSIGLLNSPLLIKTVHERLTIITGYRRIQAIKALNWDKIPCRILSQSKLPPLECLLLNFHDNLSTRELNCVEKGMVLSRLTAYLPDSEIIEHYMPLLDLPSNEDTLHLYIKIEKELEIEIKKNLAQGRLSLHTAKMLLEIDPDSRSSICQLISYLKFNINQQKQFIDYIIDISHISGKPVSDLLEEEPVKGICSDEHLNIPQKGRAVLRFLRGRRFPSLTIAESTFKKMVSKLDLPDGVKIEFPRFFEAQHFRLEVCFKEGRELKEKIESLTRKEGLGNLGNPWGEGV